MWPVFVFVPDLIAEALKCSGEPFDGKRRLVIKAIAAKQRPRRSGQVQVERKARA